MTLMMFTTMDVTSFTASADTANGTHTFTNPDTFFYTDEENKFDYKEYSLTQAQIGKAINHPGAFVNSVASITVNYKASDDISGIIIAHGSDEANGWWAEESVSISQGSNSVTTAKPIKVDNGAVDFQIKTVNSDIDLIGKTLKIKSVTLTGVEYVSEKIDADNFRFSIFNNTSMKIGDSFTVSYNAANTPPAAKYSFKYKVPKSDGSGYDYYTPILNNKVNGTDGQEATGLKVTSSTAGDVTTYTFTAIAASAAEFELYIEVSASGTWSDTAFAGSSAYKVVDSTPAPTLTFDPETANVNVGRTTTVTIIGKNTDGYEYTAKSYSDAIATATANGTVVTVTGVTIGLVKIKVTGKKSGADDITAEFTVNVPHDLEKHDAVSATCTTDGNEAYWTCSVLGCKKIFSNEDGTAEFDEIPVIPALGHDYVDGVCTRCHAAEPKITLNYLNADLNTTPTHIKCAATVENLDNPVITFVCEPADIVSITQNGAVADIQGAKAGEGTVTVTATDGTNTVSAELKVTVKCVHKTGITYVKDEDDPSSGHWKNCSVCGKVGKEREKHSMDADRITARPATCTEDGKYYDMVCAECGYRESGAVIAAKGHSFTNYVSNNDATCTADGTKTAKCDRCNETETIADVGSALGHTPAAAWTSDVTGHWHDCAGCDEKLDFSAHTFDAGTVTTPPTETIDGVKTYKCTVCEYAKTETIPATGADPEPPTPPEHTHTPAAAWTSDITGHWHACADCDEKLDFSAHTFDAGTVTTPPTETIDGVKTYKCTVCEYAKTETIPATGADPEPPTPPEHTHVFGTDWKHSETRHWHECECGEKADEALHTPDGGTVTKQPTAYETGVRTYYCTVCGSFIFSETIPATGTDPSPSIPYFPPSGTVTPPVTASKEPYIQNDSGKKGWEVISDDILSTPDGETVKVKMNGATELPKNIVSDIAGRDIDLVLDMGGYSWTINGMSVTKAKDIDMRVRKVNKIPESAVQEFFGESKTVQLDLRHNGDFGFTAELTVDVGKRYSGKYANSYCFKSGNFEFGDSSEIVNGKAKLRFTHASSWLITIESSPVLEDVSSGAAAHSAGTPIDMSNSTSGVTLPEFDEKKKLRLSNSKRRYRILKKRRLDDMVFVL